MSRLLLAASILLSASSWAETSACPDASKGWSTVNAGVCHVDRAIADGSLAFRVSGYRFDPEKYAIRLFPSIGFFEERSAARRASADGSSSVFQNYVFSIGEAYESLNEPAAVVAAVGYPRYPGDPVNRGLLRIKRTNLSDLATSEDEQRYLTALLCFHEEDGRRPGIGKVTVPLLVTRLMSEPGSKCDNAIQVGPRIVEPEPPFSRGIPGRSGAQRDDRTTFSIGRDYHFYILHWTGVSLYDVQEALLGESLASGAAPRWAVNISLRQFSGIKSAARSIGETSSTTSALLVVRPRLSQE